MKIFIVLLLINVLIYALFDSIYQYLAPFYYLEMHSLKIAGFALGHLALAGIMIAQSHMRHSWRIGIDYEHKTQLITGSIQ